MIQLTRIDGAPIVLNADLIERVEPLPDTVEAMPTAGFLSAPALTEPCGFASPKANTLPSAPTIQ